MSTRESCFKRVLKLSGINERVQENSRQKGQESEQLQRVGRLAAQGQPAWGGRKVWPHSRQQHENCDGACILHGLQTQTPRPHLACIASVRIGAKKTVGRVGRLHVAQ